MLLQSSSMVVKASAVAKLFFPVFFFVSSSFSSSSISPFYFSPSSSSSSASLFVILHTKILSRYSAEVFPSRISASVKNGGRKMELSGSQYLFFLDLVKLTAAARRSNSEIGRRILSPALAKVMSELIKITVGESSDHARANLVTEHPRNFLPIDACANVSCMSPGVELFGSMELLGKSSHTCLSFSLSSLLVHMSS